jgi:hypothetical protein
LIKRTELGMRRLFVIDVLTMTLQWFLASNWHLERLMIL